MIRVITFLARLGASVIAGIGFLAFSMLFVSGAIDIVSSNPDGPYRMAFASIGSLVFGLFGATLLRRTSLLVITSTLLNALFIMGMVFLAFGPADGPEGPEAAGRGIAALFIPMLLILEAGILLGPHRSVKHRRENTQQIDGQIPSETLDAENGILKNRISIDPIVMGRLSLAIVVVGLVYLLTILKEYNGLDGTNTGERIFLALISTGGIIGVTTYTKKKTACSALSAILFVMIMISAITMYFTELSNTSLHATAESREDAAPIGP